MILPDPRPGEAEEGRFLGERDDIEKRTAGQPLGRPS